MRRDHKHDLAFRPLETALLDGKVDAIYTQSKVFQHLQEATGKIKAIEDLSKLPGLDACRSPTRPAVITCTDVMADEHPELVMAYMKAMIKVGRWANENKHAAGAILNRQTFYLDAEDTYQGIKDVDMVPSLSAQNMECHQDRQGLHVRATATSSTTSTWTSGRARSSSRRRPRKCSRRSGQRGAGPSCPRAAGSRSKARGSGSYARRKGGSGMRTLVVVLIVTRLDPARVPAGRDPVLRTSGSSSGWPSSDSSSGASTCS